MKPQAGAGAPGRPAAALAAAAAAGLALGLAVPPTLTGAADAAATELAELAGGDPVVAALLDETPETLP
ncbi:MAG TPA: hypothetical protein VEH84_15590 [Alphaproteobacteria bacterium]|nr:hypothetical protein [Alphaproteobacteria bacterium]